MRVPIPPNYNDDGNILGGILKKRNAVEAGVYLALIFLLYKLFFSGNIFVLSLFILLALFGAFIFAIGLGDQSVCTFLGLKIRYKFVKDKVTLMKPSDDNHY